MSFTPHDVAQEIKSRLLEAASSRKSAMHTMVVGSADGDMRIMVLRDFDPETHTLRFHTDVRSPKVAAIRAEPVIHVLAYDAGAKVQVRMNGIGRIEHNGPVADAAWAAATPFAKRCYLAEAAPSSDASGPISGLPEWAEGINPTEDQVEPARENFAVLLVEISEFDWLFLANEGHRRARVKPRTGADPQFNWLVP